MPVAVVVYQRRISMATPMLSQPSRSRLMTSRSYSAGCSAFGLAETPRAVAIHATKPIAIGGRVLIFGNAVPNQASGESAEGLQGRSWYVDDPRPADQFGRRWRASTLVASSKPACPPMSPLTRSRKRVRLRVHPAPLLVEVDGSARIADPSRPRTAQHRRSRPSASSRTLP